MTTKPDNGSSKAADANQSSRKHSSAICVLGMHRSGTSCVARAMNLLGVYLGDPEKMEPAGPDNPKGFWEHYEFRLLQQRLLASLNRTWDSVHPLPDGWEKTELARPFKRELARLVETEFSGHPLWGWKDPQSCLLIPLWRDVFASSHTQLGCVFIVRNPMDVAKSLSARNAMPFNAGLGIWFHYNLVALRDTADLPVVFVSYEKLLSQWEPELRRAAKVLSLSWPDDEANLRTAMDAFIDPKLRHNQSANDRLSTLPAPVRELYQALSAATTDAVQPGTLQVTAKRLFDEFQAYAALFEPIPKTDRASWPKRTWRRWQRSVRKRLPLKPA